MLWKKRKSLPSVTEAYEKAGDIKKKQEKLKEKIRLDSGKMGRKSKKPENW